jgi:hypothetical protein
MKKMQRTNYKVCFIVCSVLMLFIIGCGPMTSTTVTLARDKYIPQLNPDDYKHFHGKQIIFHSINDQSANTSNLAFYNPEKTIGYSLYYKQPNEGMAQPVVSFFWYALKKGFDHIGIIIADASPTFDAEMFMTFRSVTDREIKFHILFTKLGRKFYEKTYTVTASDVRTDDIAVLEKRAYGIIDAMVKTIADDPDFKRMLD